MPTVSVGLTEEELALLDARAVREYDGDRSAAVETLLAEWLDQRHGARSSG